MLQTQLKYSFLPQVIPAYSATEIFAGLRKKHSEYGYKEAVLNPTNPRDRAVEWEADVHLAIPGQWKMDGDDRRAADADGRLVLRRAADQDQQSELPAMPQHATSRAQDARRSLWAANGFGWQLDEVVDV
ncbi:MAG TPA: DUF3365 domain-containing protein [Burkholderiaceae bacterium]|nr:DUF3365 domain-containing protein [Burkholderiaceae bacterium]